MFVFYYVCGVCCGRGDVMLGLAWLLRGSGGRGTRGGRRVYCWNGMVLLEGKRSREAGLGRNTISQCKDQISFR